jgi:hypothetical protein
LQVPPASLPSSLERELEALAGKSPWPDKSAAEWSAIIIAVRAFALTWGERARAAGWSDAELYAIDPGLPSGRLDRLGAAWVIASSRNGLQVVEIDATAIRLSGRSGARLSLYRSPRAA